MGAVSGRRRSGGFTIIELMVVVVVVAILTTIAVPSYRDIVQRNRIAAQVNSFVGDLQYARSEAVKRGQAVSICVSNDGKTCLGTNTWEKGWIVFADPTAAGTTPADETAVTRYRKGWAGSDTFAASAGQTAFTYTRDGFANVTAATVILRTAPVNTGATRCVAINRVGRQVVQSAGTGSCS